jgi:hypothetical protein
VSVNLEGHHTMFVHSKNGQHFLGCRTLPSGKIQLVYDCEGIKRTIFDIETGFANNSVLHSAIREAIASPKVVSTLYAKLAAQNIVIAEAM